MYHNWCDDMAAGLGLEPRMNESESLVLPLHYPAMNEFCLLSDFTLKSKISQPFSSIICVLYINWHRFFTHLLNSFIKRHDFFYDFIVISF